ELFLKLKNISDEEIRLSTSFLRDIAPEAGRSIEAGVRFNF
ncbi:MAG: iron complex outermembrane receptor protein, partial [Halieaceae bacterium]